jgi:hypothetical protein
MRIVYFALLAGSLLTGLPAMGADMDWSKVDQALGKTGTAQPGDVHKYALPRIDLHVTVDGIAIKPALALPTGSGKAAITGDFVLLATELNLVLKALRENSSEVTAVHNHMLDDQPRSFFVHFWADDDAAKLAQGLRAALDKTHVVKS